MQIKDLKDKKIAILGLGIENLSLIKFIQKTKTPCSITVYDNRSRYQLQTRLAELNKYQNIKYQLDGKLDGLEKTDIIFRAPGVPLTSPAIIKAKETKIKISSSLNLFFQLCPSKNIIGVTGSKGKGTSSSLIYSILRQAKKDVYLGGNIGIAPFDFLAKLTTKSWVVLELSSFQLEDLKSSPAIAAITNIYHEHLAPADPLNPNYHKSFSSYLKAKLNIAKYQNSNGLLFLNYNFRDKFSKFSSGGKIKYFRSSKIKTKLAGDYNQENVGLALAIAKEIGIKKEIAEQGVQNFKGLEHRLEFIKEVAGVKYYDNSFATTPESTVADINSFSQPIVIIIGGADKGSNFKPLARAIKDRVDFVVLLDGQSNGKILKSLKATKYPPQNIKKVFSMEEAVNVAHDNATPESLVLLSPACASFGLFKNYKERGQLFKESVKKLK